MPTVRDLVTIQATRGSGTVKLIVPIAVMSGQSGWKDDVYGLPRMLLQIQSESQTLIIKWDIEYTKNAEDKAKGNALRTFLSHVTCQQDPLPTLTTLPSFNSHFDPYCLAALGTSVRRSHATTSIICASNPQPM